jgi:hypothetical protein
VSALD